MSVSGKRGVGIPVILLHDAEGGIVTIELKNGFVYRGILDEAQDNMNCTMKECIRTDLVGNEARIDTAYIRGSQIKFVVLPDMLQNAPFFNRIKMWRKFKGHAVFGSGMVAGPARGQSAAIMQKSQQRRMGVEVGGRGGGGPIGGRGDGGGRGGGGGFQGPGGPGGPGGFQQPPQGGFQNQGGYQGGSGPGGYQQQQQQQQSQQQQGGGYGGPPQGGFMGGRGDQGGNRGGMGRGGYQGFQPPPQGGPNQGSGGAPYGGNNGYSRPY